MGIAFITLGGLLAPFHHMMGWFSRQPPRAAHAPRQLPVAARCVRPTRAAVAARARAQARRPLRVVRVVEGPGAPAGAGRMFMSGRMADVCAELDRLAALEAG